MSTDEKRKKNKGTETSSFGSAGRVSHDSSSFYANKMYQDLPQEQDIEYIENEVPENVLDTVICDTSESMELLPDNCIHLMVTSPPYNVGKDYDEDLSINEYLSLLRNVLRETYRVLVLGGRACVNIANLGRKPYLPINGLISQIMIEEGFLMRGEIIWNKGSSSGTSTAWGSWQSASNPTLRDIHEYIMVFSKGGFKRSKLERESTISKEEFLEFTKSIWSFPTESAKRLGHPAPFPVELPYRLIQLYSFEEDVVLDPFIGSGTTAIAAMKAKRHFVGYEIDQQYVDLAKNRIKDFAVQMPLFENT